MENLKYITCHRFATGEGTTVSLAIISGSVSDEYIGEMCKRFFGEYFSDGYEIVSRESFILSYADMIPPYVIKKMESPPPSFFWYSQIHINY